MKGNIEKNSWAQTIFTALVSIIVGFCGGSYGTEIKLDEHLNKLDEQISLLEEENKTLKSENENLMNELEASSAVSFPEGYYYPDSGIYLLDDFDMINSKACQLIDDSSINMKGNPHTKGWKCTGDGECTFYLNNKYKMLELIVGPNDERPTDADDSISITVYVDGKPMNNIITQKYSENPNKYTFDIKNGNELKIAWTRSAYASFAITELMVYE